MSSLYCTSYLLHRTACLLLRRTSVVSHHSTVHERKATTMTTTIPPTSICMPRVPSLQHMERTVARSKQLALARTLLRASGNLQRTKQLENAQAISDGNLMSTLDASVAGFMGPVCPRGANCASRQHRPGNNQVMAKAVYQTRSCTSGTYSCR